MDSSAGGPWRNNSHDGMCKKTDSRAKRPQEVQIPGPGGHRKKDPASETAGKYLRGEPEASHTLSSTD